MTLLSYANRSIYSASVHNNWQRVAFEGYARANAPRALFNGVSQDYGADVFYLYYTGDTDIVHYAISDSVTFTINSVGYAMTVGDGTFTVSGLTAGTVYEVTTSRADSNTAIYWLAFQYSISNTPAPTFTTGTVLTAIQLSDMYDVLSEVEAGLDILQIGHAYSWLDGLATGDPRDVWHGGFIGGQDDLDFNITTGGSTGATVTIIVYIDTIERFRKIYPLAETTTDENIDLSALALTAGAVHRLQIVCDGVAAKAGAKLNSLTVSSPTTLLPQAEIGRGGSVTSSSLQNMTNAINVCHPKNGTHPLWVDLPAMRSLSIDDNSWTPTDYYYLRHANRFLRYEAFASSGTPQIVYNGGSIDLSTDTGTQVYDLANLSDLAMGEYYQVTNCKYAIEDTTDA